MKTLSETEACQLHEQCRQAFVIEMRVARDYAVEHAFIQTRFFLLRANAACAQGMVYAELIGIDPAGWVDRMQQLTSLWESVE